MSTAKQEKSIFWIFLASLTRLCYTHYKGGWRIMIFLKVACDNLYRFQNFELDLTYNKKFNHPLSQDDILFENSNIKVRKNLVIMGANASGKTTFGKLLCLIENYIHGRTLTQEQWHYDTIIYDKKKPAKITAEFICNQTAYLLYITFNQHGLSTEIIQSVQVHKSYYIKDLRKRLYNSSPISNITIPKDEYNSSIISPFFSNTSNEGVKAIRERTGFRFSFSEFASMTTYPGHTNISLLNKLLPKIDNTIKSVAMLKSQGEKIKNMSYSVIFKNDDHITVPDGDLSRCEKKLSHGTFEAIDYIQFLGELPKRPQNTFYIDEQLAHMHSELEAYFIRKSILLKPFNCQLFITTHNLSIFDLNIPHNDFLFFNRNDAGYTETIYPTSVLTKNDRSLRNYYENDYFGVLPDYTVMDKIFEEKLS